MERLRVRMLESRDQLVKDNEYFLPEDIARKLAAAGVAEILALPGASPIMGPSETKPAEPPEIKLTTSGQHWVGTPTAEPEPEPPEEEEEPEPAPEPPKPEPKPAPKPEPKPVPRPPARKLPLKKHAR